MKSFFKYVLATVTGIGIVVLILFLILVGIVTSTISQMGSGGKQTTVADNSVLYVSLNHEISERTAPNPFEGIDIPGFGQVKTLGLNDIVSRIRGAKEDSKIKGIYLNLSYVNTGMASLKEIREALVDFKASGKFIVSYGDVYTQKAYYLASLSDKIYLNPAGSLEFKGLSSSIMFMKEALDKLGVEMQVVKVGTYKSAVEPFILNEMSDANRAQVTAYLNNMYSSFLTNISDGRGIPVDSLSMIADQYLIRNADDAMRLNFIDGKLYKDEMLSELKTRLGVDEKKDISAISLLDYTVPTETSSVRDRIALVYAYGDIVDGEGSEGSIGGDKLSRELRRLRRDDRVKAVVLRVNSPGGSALASDIIAREVELTKAVKPIMISMGDYAASGGYYISALADSIFAEKETLTGSIGVFGLIPNFKNLMNNKLGVRFDEVKTSKFASIMGSPDRPMSEEERAIIQLEVDRVYDTFLNRVAKGRGVTAASVDSIGQGRVWTGEQALSNGLVDAIGGIDRAIAAAAAKADLKSYKLVEYPAVKDPFASMLGASKEKIKLWIFDDGLGDLRNHVEQLKTITKSSGIQARMPYNLEIR